VTDRVFLDANVLFSAAWLDDSGLMKLWHRADTTLVASRLAVAEARRNLDTDSQCARLDALAVPLILVDPPPDAMLPPGVNVAAKDVPILLAAIEAGATHLLTGDRKHFGHLYGKTVAGVRILAPATYLAKR
jgi:uncharacterized protein